MDINWSNVIASVCTLFAAFIGAIVANELNIQKEKRNEINFERSLINSLNTELKILWELYESDLTENLEKLNNGEIFTWKYSARQDFLLYIIQIVCI